MVLGIVAGETSTSTSTGIASMLNNEHVCNSANMALPHVGPRLLLRVASALCPHLPLTLLAALASFPAATVTHMCHYGILNRAQGDRVARPGGQHSVWPAGPRRGVSMALRFTAQPADTRVDERVARAQDNEPIRRSPSPKQVGLPDMGVNEWGASPLYAEGSQKGGNIRLGRPRSLCE